MIARGSQRAQDGLLLVGAVEDGGWGALPSGAGSGVTRIWKECVAGAPRRSGAPDGR